MQSLGEKFQDILNEKFIKCFNQNLDKIGYETEKLLSLCDQLRDVSDIQSQTFKLQPSAFSLEGLLKNALKSYKKEAKKKEIKVIKCINPNLPKIIYADKQRISFVLQNLLSNAFKFTKRGFVKITINQSTRAHSSPLQQKNLQESNENFLLKFQVSDSGCGIEKDKLKYSFDLFGFVKMQNFSLEKAQGNGLGLFLSQKIAGQLGLKDIKLNSSVSQGTNVNFYVLAQYAEHNAKTFQVLPQINENYEFKTFELIQRYKQQINLAPDIMNEHEDGISQEKCECPQILIVDDTEFIRQVLNEVLSGYKIREARDGIEALQQI